MSQKEADLFLIRAPNGPVRLTDFSHSKELGGVAGDIKISRSGKYVTFRAYRKGVKPDDESFETLWLLDLDTRQLNYFQLPGRLKYHAWSPEGSLLAAETSHKDRSIYVWIDPATRQVHRWGGDNVGQWAWWGAGECILYEDIKKNALFLLDLHSGRYLARWALSENGLLGNLCPSPDGKRVMIVTPDDVSQAVRGQPIKQVSATYAKVWKYIVSDQVFWSPNKRLIALHQLYPFPENVDIPTPQATSSVFTVFDAISLKPVRKVLTIDNGAFMPDSPPAYSLCGWSRDSRWLLITRAIPRKDMSDLIELWAYDTQKPDKVKLFAPGFAVAGFDWHF
jgi:hypothetical protein